VRELRTGVEHAVALTPGAGIGVVEAVGGNRTLAARVPGLDRKTL
jgi:hypothetical protein